MKKILLGLTALVAVSCQPAYSQAIGVKCDQTQIVQNILSEYYDEEITMEGYGNVITVEGQEVDGVISILESQNSFSIVITSQGESCLIAYGDDLQRIGRGM